MHLNKVVVLKLYETDCMLSVCIKWGATKFKDKELITNNNLYSTQ